MKAEHRKELETNVLADRVGKAIQGIKEGPSAQTWMILGAIAVVFVLYLVWAVVRSHSEQTSSKLWEEWSTLKSTQEVETFAKENAKTTAGRLARFRLARQDLGQGIASLGSATQRGEAINRIKKAAEAYEQLIAETADQPHLQQEALLNAGKANETLGEIDRALNHYRRLVKDHPGSAAARDAASGIKRIEANPQDVSYLKQFLQEKSDKDRIPAPK